MRGQKKEFTDHEREQIKTLASLGLKNQDIATVMKCSERLLQYKCKAELQFGRATSNAAIAKTAFAMGTSGKHPVMTIFLCKTRLGWRETTHVEFPDKDGNPQNIAPVNLEVNFVSPNESDENKLPTPE
jgi:hypothetical protein